MSDERVREAERKWKETGNVDDEARYLLERVRVGDLMRERLELAAYCGNEGAMQACATPRPPGTGKLPSRDEVEQWAAGLAAFGKAAVVMAAIEVAAPLLRLWEQFFPDDARPRLAVDAARACLAGTANDRTDAFNAFDESNDASFEATRQGAVRAAKAASAAACAALCADATMTIANSAVSLATAIVAANAADPASNPLARCKEHLGRWALQNPACTH